MFQYSPTCSPSKEKFIYFFSGTSTVIRTLKRNLAVLVDLSRQIKLLKQPNSQTESQRTKT